MSKLSFTLFVSCVMIIVFAAGQQARSDVPDVRIFKREVSCAKFEVSAMPEVDNVLGLTINPLTSGDYSYSFSRVSGDAEYAEDSSKGYYERSNRRNVRAYFICDIPLEGTEIQYIVRASFVPSSEYSYKTESVDSYTTDNNSVCGIGHDSYHHNVHMIQLTPAYFSVSISVSNVNGTTDISIEER